MFWLQVFILLICITLIATLCISLLLQNFINVPYVPSSSKHLKQALTEIGVGPGKSFIDIGSGDGKVLFAAASLDATVTGVEINPYLSLLSKLRKALNPRRAQIHILNQNFYRIDLSKYDIVYAYLLPEILQKLDDKLYTELKPGTKIISNTFQIPGRKPTQVIAKQFYVYIV